MLPLKKEGGLGAVFEGLWWSPNLLSTPGRLSLFLPPQNMTRAFSPALCISSPVDTGTSNKLAWSRKPGLSIFQSDAALTTPNGRDDASTA